jgi:hypothetical protein
MLSGEQPRMAGLQGSVQSGERVFDMGYLFEKGVDWRPNFCYQPLVCVDSTFRITKTRSPIVARSVLARL